MKCIVAVDENWAIGCDNQLLKSIPEDMKYFKSKTMGNVVIMGRTTFWTLSNKRALPGRVNIVLSTQAEFRPENVTRCSSIQELREELNKYPEKEHFVIGGAMVYQELLPYCESCLVTRMKASFPADRHFENLEEHPDWIRTWEETHVTADGLEYSFCQYHNIKFHPSKKGQE